jgi:hypothetical protein
MYTERVTERQAIMAPVAPQSLNNQRAFTGGVDMTKNKRAFFTVLIGAVTAGSISCWLQESSDNFNTDVPSNDTASPFSGSGGANVSITGQTTSNTVVTFEVRTDQLSPGKKWVRLEVKEVNGSATIVAAVAIGEEAEAKPASAQNSASVVVAQKIVT